MESETALELPPMNRRRVLGLALPTMGENLLQTLVVSIDTFMVAELGKEQLAGVGTAAELVWFTIAILIALQVGATVLVSQAIGAGDRTRANNLAKQALAWGVVIAVPVSIGGYLLAHHAVSLFGVEPVVASFAVRYLRVTAAWSVAMVLTFVAGAVLRGAGDSRTPLYAAIAANLVNIVIAYTFIFGNFGAPKLGVAGSAFAGAAGRATSAVILLALLASGRRVVSIRGRAGWRPHLATGRSLAALGVPASIGEMSMSAGFMLMLRVVALLGTASIAAQHVAFNALSLVFMPGFAFGVATTALVGQSVGARRPEDARRAASIAMRWAMGWMGAGALIYFVAAPLVMRIFTNDDAVQRAGVDALRALALGIPLWAIWVVGEGALRGTGDTRTPMLASAVAVWGAVALAFAAVRWLDGGLGTVWLMFLLTTPVAAATNMLVFQRRIGAHVDVRLAAQPALY